LELIMLVNFYFSSMELHRPKFYELHSFCRSGIFIVTAAWSDLFRA